MAVDTLVTTPGSASANAYCSLAEADQYHENRPPVGTTWADASPEQKNAAILWATKLMDDAWIWSGYATDAIQALLWPRGAMLKRNRWEYVDVHTVPPEIKNATAEYARQLLAGDLAGNSDIETLGITSVRAGPVALTFKESVFAKPVPDTVYLLVPDHWGYPKSRNTGIRELQRA